MVTKELQKSAACWQHWKCGSELDTDTLLLEQQATAAAFCSCNAPYSPVNAPPARGTGKVPTKYQQGCFFQGLSKPGVLMICLAVTASP